MTISLTVVEAAAAISAGRVEAGGGLEGVGSSKDLREMTCWIAWDLFQDGLRIPVQVKLPEVLSVIYRHLLTHL